MFCDRCGAELTSGQAFCSACGKPVYPVSASAGAPSAPSPGYVIPAPYPYTIPHNRVAGHARILAICWLVYSLLHLIPMLLALSFFGAIRGNLGNGVPEFVPALIQLVILVVTGLSAFGLAVGWGLLTWKPWGRILAIVLGVINLLNIPLGTALGIYTLWVLLSPESEQQYRDHAISGESAAQLLT